MAGSLDSSYDISGTVYTPGPADSADTLVDKVNARLGDGLAAGTRLNPAATDTGDTTLLVSLDEVETHFAPKPRRAPAQGPPAHPVGAPDADGVYAGATATEVLRGQDAPAGPPRAT